MIRSELIQKLAEENPGLTVPEVERIVDLFFKEIVDRLGRNPRTGEQVPVSAKRVPYFKPGKEMRERLNSGSEA